MELLEKFKNYLLKNKKASKLTVKNYFADVRKFINWYENAFQAQFIPANISEEIIDEYKKQLSANETSARSAKRYDSSLRKFYSYLQNENVVASNPFELKQIKNQRSIDPWAIKEFKNYLFVSKSSSLTIKNYIIDIIQFTSWVQKTLQQTGSPVGQDMLNKVDGYLVDEYKKRLLNELKLSPISVNRKLSSLRKYLNWTMESNLKKDGIFISSQSISQVVEPNNELEVKPELTLEDLKNFDLHAESTIKEFGQYSKFPPIRLIQKIAKLVNQSFEVLIFDPLTKSASFARYNFWKISGRKIFVPVQKVLESSAEELPIEAKNILQDNYTTPALATTSLISSLINSLFKKQGKSDLGKIRNVPKSFYAPLAISTANFTWYKKIWHHLRYTRPQWYTTYSSYAVVKYFHLAIFLIFISIISLSFYKAFVDNPHYEKPLLAAGATAPPRLLSFKGRLADASNNALTAETTLRFTIYNSSTATGSARLWQEVKDVTPDQEGNFSVLLGQNTKLSQNIFTNNAALYLGITIGNDDELKPRQQLATIADATSANTLQGLSPITQASAGTRNVVLALDSSGNLTIGGNASPTFQATGGTLTLSGQVLTIGTNEGSNGNIEFKPDGTGVIDFQKPIQNTTNDNNPSGIRGAVEIDDVMAILATSSAQSAFNINQNSTGLLISASSSGIAKFTVDYTGAGMFANDLAVNGNNLTTSATTFNLLNTNAININIGGNASAISLGSANGTTTIRNSLKVNGTGSFDGAVNVSKLLTANGGLTIPDKQNLTLSGLTPGGVTFINSNNQLATDNVNFFWDNTNKWLGLGTSTPTEKLDIQDNQDNKVIAQVFNASNTTDADGLTVKLGIQTPTTTNSFINFVNGDGVVLGKITGNGTTAGPNNIVYNTSGADYAEYYKKAYLNESFSQGDMVCLSKDTGVTKCSSNANQLLGVVSTTAGFVGGGNHDTDPSYLLVGIMGQLPVKMATDSAELQSGDALTFSPDIQGAVRAKKPGQIIGRVIDASHNGNLVNVAVQVSWFDPDFPIPSSEDLHFTTDNSIGQIVSKTGKVIETIKAEIVNAKQITTDSLAVATENITISGKNIHDYIADIVNQTITDTQNRVFTQKIVSPIAEVGNAHTDIVSPLAADSDISMRFKDSKITIFSNKNASGAAVATIDNQGNASFSGTLRAKKIIADEIDLSDQGLAKLKGLSASTSANYVTNITNIYNSIATPSAQASSSADQLVSKISEISPTPSIAISSDSIASNSASAAGSLINHSNALGASNYVTNIATFSSQLTNIPNLESDFATFNEGLISLGPSSMSDVSVQGQLTLGKNMMINDTSINTIGSDLNLQPLRQGNLAMMGGLITIDTQGNLSVLGDASFAKDVTVKGKLSANLIAPIPNQDLLLQTGGNEAEKDSKVVVQDASGSGVVSINHLGDIIASGSGKFADIAANALHIIRGAQADTSLTETVSAGSAGSAIITANETQRTVFTPFVKPNSLIYVTATSDTQGQSPYVARQTADDPQNGSKGSFTIQISRPITRNASINWWIVN